MEILELISLAKLAVSENLSLVNQTLPEPFHEESSVHGLYWKSHLGKLYTIEEAVEQLIEADKFPRIVDLTIRGSLKGKPLFIWIPSGHPKTSELDETWNEGFGPFKPMGLMIPSHLGSPSSPMTKERLERIGQDWLQMTEESCA